MSAIPLFHNKCKNFAHIVIYVLIFYKLDHFTLKSSYSYFTHILTGVKQDILIFSFLLIIPLLSLAQEYSLSGKVIGVDNIPIPYSDVVLQDKDSVVVQWGLTDEEGKYTIENIKPASYTLKVSIVGYATKKTEIVVDSDITDQITVLEQEINELDEVVVRKPNIVQKIDRVVFNVKNTILSSGDVWNVLSNAPYLVETGNSILIKGREEPLIFINDKRSYLSSEELKQLLESTPANNVNSVEVITAPPAKYDAEGRSVVNIIMSKNLSIGYNGNISGSYEQGVYPKYRLSTGHFYKTDKLNLYAGYSYNIKKTYVLHRDGINFLTEDFMPSGEWYSETEEARSFRIHNINTNIDYTINDRHSLSLSANASLRPSFEKLTRSYTEARNDLQQIDSSFYSINRSTYPRHNIGFDLDYNYNISEGKKLFASMRYTSYGYNQDQNILTNYYNGDQAFIRENAFANDKEQNITIYNTKLDYTSSTSKNSTFEAGAALTNITFDNRLNQVNIIGDNIEFSDLFFYDETNLAGYISYEQNWTKWDMKLGLRAENTAIEGESVSEIETNTQNYFKIFPAAYLTYKPSDNHNFNISYVKKINRPRFNILNPFQQFLNDNAYVTGNPDLLPTIDQRINFKYTHKQSLSFTLYMYYLTDPIQQLPYVDNTGNTLIFTQANLDKTIEYGLDIMWDKNITSWWYFSTLSNAFYYEDRFFSGLESNNDILKTIRWGLYQQFSNRIKFSKTFRANVNFMYLSAIPDGNTVLGAFSNLSLGLQKTFWNKKATLSFNVNDVLGTRPARTETNYLDQRISGYSDYEYQTFEMRFTYKFGNYRLRTNKKSIDNKERDRL